MTQVNIILNLLIKMKTNVEYNYKQCLVRDLQFWMFHLNICSGELTYQSTLDQSVKFIARKYSAATLPASEEQVVTITSLYQSASNTMSSFTMPNNNESIYVNHDSISAIKASKDSNSELFTKYLLHFPSQFKSTLLSGEQDIPPNSYHHLNICLQRSKKQ